MRDFESYQMLGASAANFIKLLAINTAQYVGVLAYPCDDVNDAQCFAPGPRTFDLISPMGEAKVSATAVAQIVRGTCGAAAPITDMILYPFLDINFAKSVHNLINGCLFLILQVPSITSQRCLASKGDTLMCWPDFSAVFNFWTAGLRNLGRLIDNWFDVSTVIIQAGLGIDTSDADCAKQALTLTPANYSTEVFGTNETTTVGLTEGLYAVTDGTFYPCPY